MHARLRPPAGLVSLLLIVPALALTAGCSSDPEGPLLGPAATSTSGLDAAQSGPNATAREFENPPFEPANFVTGVNHPFFPLVPGTTFTFLEPDGDERTVIEVLHETKDILGVTATVVRDRVYVGDDLVEDTLDWFAQDKDGNVWYLGEDVKNYAGGQLVDTEGSWEAGMNGARAGINMLAEPEVGDAYFQEDAPGVAEDKAKVKRDDVDVSVPYGDFEDCLQTLEWITLEPGSKGFKFYARGVGLVLESGLNGKGRSELVSVTTP